MKGANVREERSITCGTENSLNDSFMDVEDPLVILLIQETVP